MVIGSFRNARAFGFTVSAGASSGQGATLTLDVITV
jgi:hypothetical protein